MNATATNPMKETAKDPMSENATNPMNETATNPMTETADNPMNETTQIRVNQNANPHCADGIKNTIGPRGPWSLGPRPYKQIEFISGRFVHLRQLLGNFLEREALGNCLIENRRLGLNGPTLQEPDLRTQAPLICSWAHPG